MSKDTGASRSATGLAGAEAPEPLWRLGPSDGIPSACAKCGAASVRVIVEGEPLCSKHTMEWAHQEARLADEERVCRVMRALDKIAEETPNGPWETHLRRMAEAAVDAM